MNPVKSGTSYFRRALKIKGRTEHSGRGFFELDYDCDASDLRVRIDNLVKKFPERFDVEQGKTFVQVKLKSEYMRMPYYGTLRLTDTGNLLVGM